MNTEKIDNEFRLCLERLNIHYDESLNKEKMWWLIGAVHIMSRFASLPDEMSSEQIDDFYDNLMIEAQFEILNLSDKSDDDDFGID
jgi:hypothetical protein